MVRLSPRALNELHVEARGISLNARKASHTAECDLCGESVECRLAVPNDRGKPVHRGCYADAYTGAEWIGDYWPSRQAPST
jgi:formylmethanofuran dehydrogenase subunit E